MTQYCPADPGTLLDEDGFCPTHGSDCDDYALHLHEEAERDETDQLPTADPDKAIAFLADSRASTIMLSETIDMLAGDQRIHHGLVEVHSPAGLVIGAALLRNQVDYSVLAFGQDLPSGAGADDPVTELLANAVQIIEIEPHTFAQLHAQLCVIPAMVGSGEMRIDPLLSDTSLDFSPTTLPGLVLEQAHRTGRSLMVIDSPERGLVRQPDDQYLRRVLHVRAEIAIDTEGDQ